MTIDRRMSADELEDESLNTGSDKVYQNYMMPGLELYDAKVSVNHWQLRDCVKHNRDSTRGDPGTLYYIYDHSIRALNTSATDARTQQRNRRFSGLAGRSSKKRKQYYHYPTVSSELSVPSHEVVDFNFKPRCFSMRGDLIACGGLVGPDDKGFPTNWNRLLHSKEAGRTLPLPAKPIKLTRANMLEDQSNYSNPTLWKGILSIHNMRSKETDTIVVGQFINNCVALHAKNEQEYDLYACNNDNHIYQCNISNRGVELVRRYSDLKFALNHAAISNDGQSMLVSGDSNKFALYRKEQPVDQFTLTYGSGSNYNSNTSTPTNTSQMKRIPRYAMPDETTRTDQHIYEAPNADHGFYSSFSENDSQIATIFQNGVCLLYDARQMCSPIAEINSTRPYSHNGAFRVCKFSHGLDDLLFISEHQGRVHVVDTRNLSNHQVIMVPDKFKTDSLEDEHNKPSAGGRTGLDFRRRNIYASTVHATVSPSSSPSASSLSYNPISSRRRYSYPPIVTKEDEPWVTSARSVPLSYLTPLVQPYPKVASKSANEFNSVREQGIEPDTGLHGPRSEQTTYRVRRVSTSSVLSDGADAPVIYPAGQSINQNIGHGEGLVSPHRTHLSSVAAFDDGNMNNVLGGLADDDITDPVIGRSDNNRNYETAVFSDGNEAMEENNIIGIDWMEDNNSSALVIGTDYGIIKWNINSWARRSFASYDFC